MRIDNLAKWIETTCASTLRIIEMDTYSKPLYALDIDPAYRYKADLKNKVA